MAPLISSSSSATARIGPSCRAPATTTQEQESGPATHVDEPCRALVSGPGPAYGSACEPDPSCVLGHSRAAGYFGIDKIGILILQFYLEGKIHPSVFKLPNMIFKFSF